MGHASIVEDSKQVRRGYATPGRPMLLIADHAGAADTELAIGVAGGRLLQRVIWTEAAATLDRLASWPVIVVDASGVSAAVLDGAMPAIATYLERGGGPAVVMLSRDQIDTVALHLLGLNANLLCEASYEQRIAAIFAASIPRRPALHDSWRESDGERLQRLTDEVARIAQALAKLIHHDEPRPARQIADRRRSYDGEPVSSDQPIEPQEVRRIIHLRRIRGKFFRQFSGEGLFEDPAWDMLLDLFAAELEGAQVSVSSLCIAAGVAPTTALRWIAKMTEMELFIRHPDPVDRRRAFMALSSQASEAMSAYMIAVRKLDPGGG